MGPTPLTLLTAVPGPEEALLVARLGAHPGVVVVRRCADMGELVSASAAGLGRAALVSADLHRLDREVLARLEASGTAVVGVVPAGGVAPLSAEAATARLTALGVLHRVAADAAAVEVAAVVGAAVAAHAHRVTDRASGPVEGPGAPRTATAPTGRTPRPEHVPQGTLVPAPRPAGPADPAGPDARTTGQPAPRGVLVAVWGPAGAPGRTTVAASTAAELARLGEATLLVDADTWAASAAQVLGLLDESAGVASACRAAAAGTLTPGRLRDLAPEVLPGLSLLTGLPRADRWPELGAAALEQLWVTCRATAPWTVVDCAAPLEQDEELAFDTAAPRRNAATTTALAAADVVLVVGQADPVGLQRLVRALADLAQTPPVAGQHRQVVVTRVRASAVGPDPAGQVRQALELFAGVRDAVLVPDDRAACDAALLAGRTLAESAPGSPARAALAALALALVERHRDVPAGGRTPTRRGAPAPGGRRRWARMRG